ASGAPALRGGGARPPPDLLRTHLRGRRLLLVRDTLGPLRPAGPVLAGLLADAPGLTLLVTSRAPLRLAAEQEYPVPPLALPEVSELPAAPHPAAAEVPVPELLRADAV